MHPELPRITWPTFIVPGPIVLVLHVEILAARRGKAIGYKSDTVVDGPAVDPLGPADGKLLNQCGQLRTVHISTILSRRPVSLDVFQDRALEILLDASGAGESTEIIDLCLFGGNFVSHVSVSCLLVSNQRTALFPHINDQLRPGRIELFNHSTDDLLVIDPYDAGKGIERLGDILPIGFDGR